MLFVFVPPEVEDQRLNALKWLLTTKSLLSKIEEALSNNGLKEFFNL